jgi:hypothetical protein
MKMQLTRRASLGVIGSFVAWPTAGCATIPIGQIGEGRLSGTVLVQWVGEDEFIYRKTSNPLTYEPSFTEFKIVPESIYTDGGSIPRIFWGIPGLSPWGLGPAYIIHDWLF